jgi:drug/metabolite transporter (DMT)-like permease
MSCGNFPIPLVPPKPSHRLLPYLYLALASLFWAGNQVTGRALRDDFGPLALSFWRWLIAALVLAPFVWSSVRAQAPLIRQHWKLIAMLSLLSVVLFQSFIYAGLRSTTAINAVLLNSCIPLFILACSWIMDGERATPRQLMGMAVSSFGILVIVTRGEPAHVAQLDLHSGDLWILAAMPVWALYSVLLRRKPAELGGMPLVFVLAAGGVAVLAPAGLLEMQWIPQRMPGPEAVAGVIYIGLFASILALACWNAGVAAVGANIAGFTLHLLPMFGTLLAMMFLGEVPQLFHATGFAAILGGVVLASLSDRTQ